MKAKSKKVFKFIVTGGGCLSDLDLIKFKIEEFKEKRANKKKQPTVREIKDARGIRVIPVETHNYWDDYWDDDEETLCSQTFFIRETGAETVLVRLSRSSESIPRQISQPDSEPASVQASQQAPESAPTMRPTEANDDEPEPRPKSSSFTLAPEQELASRNQPLYRQQLDEQEHSIFKSLGGPELYLSNVENPERILCTGPGTVTWAIEVAEKFPQAEVLCLDPHSYPRLMPRNCHVETSDIRNYSPDSGWDFVYIRCTRSAIYWPRILERCQTITRIGGWVEMVDLMREGGPICTCYSVINCIPEFSCAICESFPALDGRELWMADVGFENVKQEIRKGEGRVENPYRVESTTLYGKLVSRPASAFTH